MDVADGAGVPPGSAPTVADESDNDAPPMPAVPPPPPPVETDAEREARLNARTRDRLFAKSRKHLLTHTPHNASCEGCDSKTENYHFKDAYLESGKKHDNMITMDQVSITELREPRGIGNFKSEIIFRRIDTGH